MCRVNAASHDDYHLCTHTHTLLISGVYTSWVCCPDRASVFSYGITVYLVLLEDLLLVSSSCSVQSGGGGKRVTVARHEMKWHPRTFHHPGGHLRPSCVCVCLPVDPCLQRDQFFQFETSVTAAPHPITYLAFLDLS